MDITEVWLPTYEPFSSRYDVSNKGRVRLKKPGRRPKLLKPSRIDLMGGRSGYMKIMLTAGPLKKLTSVHRMVAIAFVPGDTSLDVNHKDLDKCNNLFTNLEWLTHAENLRHARALNPLWSVHVKESSHKRAIIGTDLLTGLETEYPSINEAARLLTGRRKTAGNICHALKNGRAGYGKRWKYAA